MDALRGLFKTFFLIELLGGLRLTLPAPDIVEAILDEPKSSGLLIYPTKALAQDQLRSFRDLGIPEVKAATYDGDVSGNGD